MNASVPIVREEACINFELPGVSVIGAKGKLREIEPPPCIHTDLLKYIIPNFLIRQNLRRFVDVNPADPLTVGILSCFSARYIRSVCINIFVYTLPVCHK